jgi:L-alanine-DL-glutamate epimerase-like enolase superfamily enzyme
VTHGGTGVSTRAHSAVDIALWDLFGKVCDQPLYQLLGGKVLDNVLSNLFIVDNTAAKVDVIDET